MDETRRQQIEAAVFRRRVYGMPYAEWKKRYQRAATPARLARFQGGKAPGSDPQKA